MSPSLSIIAVTVAALGSLAQAHEHGHSHIDEGETVTAEPLVGYLRTIDEQNANCYRTPFYGFTL